MGIALSTLSTLPAPLRALSRWLQQNLFLEPEKPSGNVTAPSPSNPPSHTSHGHTSPRHQGASAGLSTVAGSAGSPSPIGSRPLRGNWPFNVRPPAPAPHTPAGPSASNSNRSFLPHSSIGSRDAFFASLSSADGRTNPSARVLRRISDAGTGRLVITGRMADVCAELDRMAALESLQTR